MEAAADRESDFYDSQTYHNWGDNSTSVAPPSIGFQRLLGKFFGDYFKEDADEEIASDMADRWVSFAKTGDPNYISSKAQWRPWRYLFDDEGVEVEDGRFWQPEDFDEIFDISHINEGQPYINDTVIEGYFWSDDPEERTYRRRALIALGMEVVEEDVFQTMLRRIKFGEEMENPFHQFWTRIASSGAANRRAGGGKDQNVRRAIRQLQRMAQDMGFLGTGLGGEPRRRDVPLSDYWEDSFFPEIMELKWPPEGRLVEVSIHRIGSYTLHRGR
jgi:Carboxylesterase family